MDVQGLEQETEYEVKFVNENGEGIRPGGWHLGDTTFTTGLDPNFVIDFELEQTYSQQPWKEFNGRVRMDFDGNKNTGPAKDKINSVDWEIHKVGGGLVENGTASKSGDHFDFETSVALETYTEYEVRIMNADFAEGEILHEGYPAPYRFRTDYNPDWDIMVSLSDVETTTNTFDANVNIDFPPGNGNNPADYFTSIGWKIVEKSNETNVVKTGTIDKDTNSIRHVGFKRDTIYTVKFETDVSHANSVWDSEIRTVAAGDVDFVTSFNPERELTLKLNETSNNDTEPWKTYSAEVELIGSDDVKTQFNRIDYEVRTE